jgi:hypothetical protein
MKRFQLGGAVILGCATIATLLLSACSSATEAKRTPTNISPISGTGQNGFTGLALAQPMVVQVTAADGTPFVGQVVDFTVQSGQATTNPTSATTDANGNAQTVVTIGPTAGTVVIIATVHATSLNAVFTVIVQAATDASCTGATPVSLAVGEARASVSGSNICLTNAIAAEYLVHVFFGSSVSSAQTQVGLTGSGITTASVTGPATAAVMNTVGLGALRSIAPRSAALSAADPARLLDLRLRQLERNVLAPRMAAARAAMNGRRALRSTAPPAVGQLLSLNVDEACTKLPNPNVRIGRVAAVTNSAVVVADTGNPAGGFTDADYQSIGTTFDTLVNPLDTAAFGAPTDIDGNGRVIIFYTRAVNALTPANSSGLIGGYFNPRDLFPLTPKVLTPTDTLEGCDASNVGEMFYVLVPDPTGSINGHVQVADSVKLITIATLGHEYQHLINESRRIYVNNADAGEEVWLNEGLSHIAEELLYYHVAGLTPRQNIDGISIRTSQQRVDAFNHYQVNNAGRFDLFLSSPTINSPYADNDSLETRGATWAFLRYAADHQGAADGTIWRQLVNSTTSGFQNLTTVFGGTILNEIRDWSISIYTDDQVATAAAYQEPSWNLRSFYQQAFQTPIPFPLAVSALVNGTQRLLTVSAGGSFYAKVGVAAGATAAVSWAVTSPSVQISIVRTK